MKYLEGQTPKHRVSGKPLKVELVLDWGIQIAGALMPRTPKESSIAMSSRHIGLQP